MATPHIGAELGQIASTVLMPGDPRRAQRMVNQIMDAPEVVSDIRGVRVFTGTYAGDGPHNGKLLSIMASGMGMASMGLYATELYRFFEVERIVRVGTCGGISPAVSIGDVIVVSGAHTTSSMNELRIPGAHFSAVADVGMASAALAVAESDPLVHAGTVITTDHFYFNIPGQLEALVAHNVLAVEMESAGLYGVAAEFTKSALSVLTVSDHLTKPGIDMTATERETTFQTALNLAIAAAWSK